MAGGFNFSIDFDSSQFKRGSDDAAASLEKLGEALDDVARTDTTDAERGVDDLGTAARDAEGDAESLESKFASTFQAVGEDAKDAGDKMERELERPVELDVDTEGPLTKTQDLANEIRGSIGETMGELAGSFADGGAQLEDIVDGVVEVSAEAAGALPGPWGLAGQALITTASAVYGAWKKRMEDIAEDASAMYADMTESGADFLSEDFFQKKLRAFFDPMGESYESNMDKIQILEDLGVPMDEAARALVGYGDLSEEQLGRVNDALGINSASGVALAGVYDVLGVGSKDVLYGIVKDLADSKESTDLARRAVNNYRDSIEEIPGKKKTRVDVDDNGSIRDTQRDINRIHGKDVTVRAIADVYSAEADLARLSQTYNGKTLYMNVETRRTGGFYP